MYEANSSKVTPACWAEFAERCSAEAISDLLLRLAKSFRPQNLWRLGISS